MGRPWKELQTGHEDTGTLVTLRWPDKPLFWFLKNFDWIVLSRDLDSETLD